jgi:hypothetical protein
MYAAVECGRSTYHTGVGIVYRYEFMNISRHPGNDETCLRLNLNVCCRASCGNLQFTTHEIGFEAHEKSLFELKDARWIS